MNPQQLKYTEHNMNKYNNHKKSNNKSRNKKKMASFQIKISKGKIS